MIIDHFIKIDRFLKPEDAQKKLFEFTFKKACIQKAKVRHL